MEQATELWALLSVHQFYAASIILVPILLALVKAKESRLFLWLPASLHFLVPGTLVFGTAFVESAATGAPIQAALIWAVQAALIGAPATVGVYHMAKRAKPQGGSGKAAAASIVLLLASGATGCGMLSQQAPQVAQWALKNPGAVIGAVEQILNNFETWRDQYGDFAPSQFGQAQQYVDTAREKLGQAREFEKKGREFASNVEQLTREAAALLEQAKEMIAVKGLVVDDRFVSPVGSRSAAGPDSLDAKLPELD